MPPFGGMELTDRLLESALRVGNSSIAQEPGGIMQSQNVAEYKVIREDLDRVRNCMTTYVGYVILGSGPAFGFLANRASDQNAQLAMGFAAMLLCIISVLILFLLSYKFTSHNRYAGYSKLLMHERFENWPLLAGDIFLWEICLDKLRAFDSDRTKLQELLKYCEHVGNSIRVIGNLKKMVEPYSGPHPKIDNSRWYKGWPLLLFNSRDRSGSWRLPLYLARIFGIIDVTFISFAVYFLCSAVGSRFFALGVCCLGLLLVVLLTLWIIFVSRLERQMRGSETVEAFCCKFVPIRLQLLIEINCNRSVGYRLIGTSLNQDANLRSANTENNLANRINLEVDCDVSRESFPTPSRLLKN